MLWKGRRVDTNADRRTGRAAVAVALQVGIVDAQVRAGTHIDQNRIVSHRPVTDETIVQRAGERPALRQRVARDQVDIAVVVAPLHADLVRLEVAVEHVRVRARVDFQRDFAVREIAGHDRDDAEAAGLHIRREQAAAIQFRRQPIEAAVVVRHVIHVVVVMHGVFIGAGR